MTTVIEANAYGAACQNSQQTLLASIAISLKRVADAQERQADSMDALGTPPSLDEQIGALAQAFGR